MDPLILLVILILGFILLGWFVNKKMNDVVQNSKPSGDLIEYLNTTNLRLNEQNRSFNQRLDNAAKVIGDLQKNIGEMSEIGRGMKELQSFLQSPKLRGNIGEQILKDLITQMLPKSSFFLQHTFKSGEKVDAAIKTAAGILPIDSKFPMENFLKMREGEDEKEKNLYKKLFFRDISKHVLDISRKYILPEEGTMDFALMYIPSESVYYEVVNEPELLAIAQKSRVYPVSPTTLYAHLQTILLSFEGQKVEEKAREVFTILRAIKKDYSKVEENLQVLQKHVTNSFNMMGNVFSSFTQLGQKITSTQRLGEKTKDEIKQIE